MSLLSSPPGPGQEQAQIHTRRLILRPLTPSDIPAIFDIHRREEAMRWAYQPSTSISQTHEWLQSRLTNKSFIYGVVLPCPPSSADAEPTTTDPLIGLIGSTSPYPLPEIGYMFHPSHYGRGYATEALQAFIPLFWERLPSAGGVSMDLKPDSNYSGGGHEGDSAGYDYMEAATDSENMASHRVLEKCGFSVWSRTEDDFESPIMGTRSTVRYRIARPGTRLSEPPKPSVSGFA